MFQEWKKIVFTTLKIIDKVILLIVIGITLFLIFYLDHILEQVPQHWNGYGEIDSYADAGGYIMLVILMYFFYAWHQITKLIPMFDCKESYLKPLYWMLWCCDLLLQIACAYIILCGVFLRNLGIWFLPTVFVLLAADFIWFFIRIKRL